jgi:hypothetical protein
MEVPGRAEIGVMIGSGLWAGALGGARIPNLLTLLYLSRTHARVHRPGELAVELAGDVALEAAADLPGGLSLGGAPGRATAVQSRPRCAGTPARAIPGFEPMTTLRRTRLLPDLAAGGSVQGSV